MTPKRLLLALCLAAAASLQAQGLPPSVQAALARTQTSESAFAAVVLPLSGQVARLSQREHDAMAPASTLKLLTTTVALDELGPTFRWHTQLLSERAWRGATLHGPLYLRGGGDPDLNWPKLQLMLRALRAQGLRRWHGDLVLDRSAFAPERADLGPAPFDESPDADYNVIPDAALVHSNLLELELNADARAVQVSVRTPLDGVRVRSQLTLIDGPCKDWDQGWRLPELRPLHNGTWQVTLRGSFPRGCQARTSSNILARNAYIEALVRRLWRELGGSWSGHVRDGHAPPGAQVRVDQASDTLADSVKRVNKRSDNAMARTLYLTLGAQAAPASANHFDAAEARVRAWLARQGIDAAGLVLDNGSGLSRTERITPRQLAQVLQTAARSPWWAELATSLPIAALDGAMKKRLVGTSAALRARIKTGTLRDAVAVAGYVRDTQGQDWVVVAMVNQPDAARARPALDALIEWVAAGPAVPAVPAEKP